jgi:hypothetical protein
MLGLKGTKKKKGKKLDEDYTVCQQPSFTFSTLSLTCYVS